MDLTHRIRDQIMKEHLVFVYRGVVTRENSIPLLMFLEKEMENSEFGFLGRKRLFMFVLESLQNISRHSYRDRHADMSLIIYSKHKGDYSVTTGNVIKNPDVRNLKSKLDAINKLSINEIREVYLQMLSTAEFNFRGGAGLGLIDMARTTASTLMYDFVTIDDQYSYFILTKTVDSEGLGLNSGTGKRPAMDNTVSQLEKLMSENHVYLIWSGHISADIGREVLSLAETKLTEEDIESDLRRRVFRVLVEILENLAKYSPGSEPEEKFGMPVAIIRLKNNSFMVSTGNLILNAHVSELKEKLDTINSYDKAGLKELFRESLSGQNISSDSTGNMGLIDMARKSGSKLDYQFQFVNDIYSYFILNVKVLSHPD